MNSVFYITNPIEAAFFFFLYFLIFNKEKKGHEEILDAFTDYGESFFIPDLLHDKLITKYYTLQNPKNMEYIRYQVENDTLTNYFLCGILCTYKEYDKVQEYYYANFERQFSLEEE